MVAESLAAISGVVSQIQTIKDALGAAIKARDVAVFDEKAVELNAKIIAAQELALAAQAAQAALVERERALEEKIAELEAWNAEKERYKLDEIIPGAFAYALKEGMSDAEPMHYICAHCYQDKRAFILQKVAYSHGRAEAMVCPHCDTHLYIHGHPQPEHFGVRSKRRS